MLPKKNRADRKQIEQIFKSGGFLMSPTLSFKFVLPKKEQSPTLPVKPTQISFIVPKTVSKRAVKRNLLRRCGYDALKPHLDTLPAGTIGAFMFKKHVEDIDTLSNEIQNILKKIQY